jgi:hypothetical protein
MLSMKRVLNEGEKGFKSGVRCGQVDVGDFQAAAKSYMIVF